MDITNLQQPARVASYGTSAGFVAVSGGYQYLIEPYTGVVIVYLTNPKQPQRVGGFQFSNVAGSLAVSDHYVYLVGQDARVVVLDVTDPAHPRRVGDYRENSLLPSAVEMTSWGLIAANDSGGIQILSVTNPARPRLIGQ